VAETPPSQKPGFWKNFWLSSERFIEKPGFLSSHPPARNRVSGKTFGSFPRDLLRNPVSYPPIPQPETGFLEKLLALFREIY
jgi:hypothetical protein